MICKNCSKQISEDSAFCNFCGSKVELNPVCPQCNTKLVEGSLFCNKCGARVEMETQATSPQYSMFDEEIVEVDLDALDGIYELDRSYESYEFEEIYGFDDSEDIDKFGEPIVIEQDFSIYEDKNNCWAEPPDRTKMNSYTIKKRTDLTNIIIPEGITEIGDGTFSEWSSLKKVSLPNSVKKIEDYAFRMCQNLSEINIPESVEEIRSGAFADCKSLKSIIIPRSVKYISKSVFYGCPDLTIFCESGSAAEYAAIEEWVNFSIFNSLPYKPDASSKPSKPSRGRFCGTHCCNVNNDIMDGHEYGGWYYDVYFDKNNNCHLVRFDEDNVNAIEYLWSDENMSFDKMSDHHFNIQVNRRGVFLFIGSIIFWFDHLGVLKERLETEKLIPLFATKLKKEKKEWKDKNRYNKYVRRLFSCIWVYDNICYFTTKYDDDKGMIYKYDFSSFKIDTFKIAKPRKADFFLLCRLTGDERFLLFSIEYDELRIYDTETHSVNKTNAYYIDFETKRCYYENGVKPAYTPEGFKNYVINQDLFDTARGKTINGTYVDGFYDNNYIFTGAGFYGFRYRHLPQYANEKDHYYNLYRATENSWQYLNAGSRAGIEKLNVQGKYLCFGYGMRARIDGGGMDEFWFGHGDEASKIYKSEEIFRRYFLQTTNDEWPDALIDV